MEKIFFIFLCVVLLSRIGEGEFDRFLDMGRIHDSVVRDFGRIMAFDGFGADSFFRDKFYGGAEEELGWSVI